MRNTLIFTDQIDQNRRAGAPVGEAIAEATVRRAPVVLPALTTPLAFVPLTFSLFWSALAVVTLLFLPAMCALVLRETEAR